MNLFKRLFHRHKWSYVYGVGMFEKRGDLVRLPVTKKRCEDCGKVKFETGQKINIQVLVLITVLVLCAGVARAEFKYNAMEGKWENAEAGDQLKYNPMQSEWSYEPANATPKYNPQESKWEQAAPQEQLKYNTYENKWSYEEPKSQLKYNPFEGKWEYAK